MGPTGISTYLERRAGEEELQAESVEIGLRVQPLILTDRFGHRWRAHVGMTPLDRVYRPR